MRETIEHFRNLLVARMGVLEEEIRLAEALYKERHGDYRDVTLENVAVFERQAHDIAKARERAAALGIADKVTFIEGDLFEADYGPLGKMAFKFV